MEEIPAVFVGTLHDVAHAIVGILERTLKMWAMRTLDVIFLHLCCVLCGLAE